MATVIQGAKSSKYIKTKSNGIEGSEDTLNYATVQDVVGERSGIDMVQHGKSKVLSDLIIEAGSVGRKIKSTSHGMKKGWIMQPTSGVSTGEEIAVLLIVDVDHFIISAPFDMAIGDTFDVYRHITANYNADGDLNVQVTSAGVVEYNEDGVQTKVFRDTTDPLLNKNLPVQDDSVKASIDEQTLKFIKDGLVVEVSDNSNPSNVAAIPVKIMASDGTNVTINAGDINVRISSEGANFDSTRVGDGTGKYVEITSDNEAKVNDEKNGIKLDTIATAVDDLATSGLATEAKQDAVISALTGISTEAKQDAAIAILSDLSTEAKQDLILTALGLQATSAKQDTLITGVSGLPTSGLATNTKLEELKTAIAAISTGLATEATLLPINTMLTDTITPAVIATDSSPGRMIDFLARIAKNITTMAAKLPATLGQKLMAQSLSVTIASNQTAIAIDKAPASSGFQNKGTLVDGAVTSINPPSGALGCIVRNKGSSAGTLHWEISATNATAGSFDLIPLTSTVFLECNASVHLFANEGDVDYVVQWLVK